MKQGRNKGEYSKMEKIYEETESNLLKYDENVLYEGVG